MCKPDVWIPIPNLSRTPAAPAAGIGARYKSAPDVRQAMKPGIPVILAACVVFILITGCTGPAPAPATTPAVQSPAPASPEPPEPVATTPASAALTPVPIPAAPSPAVPAVSATDPILHRYIREYNDNTGQKLGYEFRFYQNGTVIYREGLPKTVSGNIVLSTVTRDTPGTWSALGNLTYNVTIPPSKGGDAIDRTYTLVPAHPEPNYPGVTVPEQIQSPYETAGVIPGEPEVSSAMRYPERADPDGSG